MRFLDSLLRLAGRLAVPLWIGYIASAAWYVHDIVRSLDVPNSPQPPIFFAPEHQAGDIFAVVGTFQWLVFGINRRVSGAASVAPLILAGLHILLLAIRAYIVPMRWMMEQLAR